MAGGCDVLEDLAAPSESGCVNTWRSHWEQESGTKECPACSARLPRATGPGGGPAWEWGGAGMAVGNGGCEITAAATVHTDPSRPLKLAGPRWPCGAACMEWVVTEAAHACCGFWRPAVSPRFLAHWLKAGAGTWED